MELPRNARSHRQYYMTDGAIEEALQLWGLE